MFAPETASNESPQCSLPFICIQYDDLIMYVGLFCHSAVAFRVFMFYGLSVWLCFFQ